MNLISPYFLHCQLKKNPDETNTKHVYLLEKKSYTNLSNCRSENKMSSSNSSAPFKPPPPPNIMWPQSCMGGLKFLLKEDQNRQNQHITIWDWQMWYQWWSLVVEFLPKWAKTWLLICTFLSFQFDKTAITFTDNWNLSFRAC